MWTSAVVFVSHSMPLISSFCTRVMVMDHGRTVLDTMEPGEGVNHYYGLVKSAHQVSGSGEAHVLGAFMTVDDKPVHEEDPTLSQGAEMVVTLSVHINDGRKGHVTVLVDDASLAPLLGVPVVDEHGEFIELGPGDHTLKVPMGRMDLNVGKYAVLVTVRDAVDNTNLCRHQGLLPFRVHADRVYWAKFIRMDPSERLSGPIVDQQNQPLHERSGAQ